MKKTLLTVLIGLMYISAFSQEYKNPPSWAKNAIWYQIFVERFSNGDKTNDPTEESTSVPNMKIIPPKDWVVSSWTSNWFKRQTWEQDASKDFGWILQYRRYGGDLQGVLDKLDYLEELGVNAIFFNPINDAPSLHKYDARNYHHIDINFGPDPEGDKKIMETENPADPATWKWTSADRLFLKIVEELHNRGMKVIMDYSWNHTGTMFWAWQDILKNQSKSKYKDWYEITTFDDPNTPENEFSYKGWYGNAYLPELKKVNITSPRENGLPYEGNINNGAKQHIFDVTKRWMEPNGVVSKGIDGFRLDVAEQIGLGFWRDYRHFVKEINPEAYLVGEIWWQKWPNKLMDPTPYMKGDIFDAIMYYQVYKPARAFFMNSEDELNAQQFVDSLNIQWSRISKENVFAMMNVSSSHDSPRLLTDFYNRNRYKYHANPIENPYFKTGKPDKEAYQRLKLYLIHLFTTVGAPQIWNGEEMGMWGGDDPYNRKPLMWKDMKFEKEYRNNFQEAKKQFDKVEFNQTQFDLYKKLILLRKTERILCNGDIKFIIAEGKKLAYQRYIKDEKITVLFNVDSVSQKFTLEGNNILTDLLTGKKYHSAEIQLKPFSAVVLKLK